MITIEDKADEYIKLVQCRANAEGQSFVIIETMKGAQYMSLNTYIDHFQYIYRLVGHVLPEC